MIHLFKVNDDLMWWLEALCFQIVSLTPESNHLQTQQFICWLWWTICEPWMETPWLVHRGGQPWGYVLVFNSHRQKWASIISPLICMVLQSSFAPSSAMLTPYHFMSSVLLLLHPSVLPPSSSSEPLEEHHVAQLLRCFSTDLSLGRHLSLDGAQAHHLQQCSYHLRLFRNWLISGQDPLEYLHGQPPWLRPSIPPASRPRSATGLVGTVLVLWFTHALLLGVSACLPVSVVLQIASWSVVSCSFFVGHFCNYSFPLQWCHCFLPQSANSHSL